MATVSPTKTSSSSSSEAKKSDSTTQEASNSSQTTAGNPLQDSEDCLGNPTRDTLAEGLIGLLTPSIEQLDQGISNARDAQLQLRDQLVQLETQLTDINSELEDVVVLDPYVMKLLESKKKVIVINSMLQDAQDRLNRVHQNCLQETVKRRTLLEPASASLPSSASTSQPSHH